MKKDALLIARLIAHHQCRDLNSEEKEILSDWIKSSSENEALFHKICDEDNFKLYMEQASHFNMEQAKKETTSRILHAKRQRMRTRILQMAASVCIPILMASLIFYYVSKTEITEIDYADSNSSIATLEILPIQPGKQKASLQLSEGTVVDLNNDSEIGLTEVDGTTILITENTIKYKDNTHKKDIATLYNTITVPEGGEYSVKLRDGTIVYLNSMSSLKFPVQFQEDKRVVELEGEAFFDVSKNGTPFIVKTPQTQVDVLGTTFNISAFEGEETLVTLVKGSVRVSTKAKSVLLTPSQQAMISSENAGIKVKQVDAEFYSSWYTGKIYFRDTRLIDIMKNLARWYKIDVSYGDEEVANLRFGCYINRHKEIAPFLNYLRDTGRVRIVQKENKISFYSK